MKDKIELVMQETGCEESEAELALELCGYELEKAVAAVPRLFQNIAVLKGKMRDDGEALYGLLLIILNLKDRSLVRARAVVSCNPAVYTAKLDAGWFDFEKHLYACRLWDGSVQSLSQEVEQLLASYFAGPEAAPLFHNSQSASQERLAAILRSLLARRFGPERLRLIVHRDVLDMGQFQQIGPDPGRGSSRSARSRRGISRGSLILKIALEPEAGGTLAGELRAGDLVYAVITDSRDIAQYLAQLFGPSGGSLLMPVEAVERAPGAQVGVRVRFSLGVCGDVNLPVGSRLKVARRSVPSPWWKKLLSG